MKQYESLGLLTKRVATFFQKELEEREASMKARFLMEAIFEITPLQWASSLSDLFESQKIHWIFTKKLEKKAPLARWLGYASFLNNRFFLNEATLDPRWESEGLVQLALSYGAPPSILDLGTGSGCLLISLLKQWPLCKGTGIDISSRALEAAVKNAELHQVLHRSTWKKSYWFSHVEDQFHMIIANPPYVRTKERMDEEVLRWDPMLALDGGPEGKDAYQAILSSLPAYLYPQGRLLLEIASDQKDWILQAFKEKGLEEGKVIHDHEGCPRYATASH